MANNKIVLYDLFTSRIFCFSCVPSVSCCCWWGLCRNVSWWCRQFWAGTRVVFGMSPRSWSGICRRPPRTRWLHHLAKHYYHISNIQFKISINPPSTTFPRIVDIELILYIVCQCQIRNYLTQLLSFDICYLIMIMSSGSYSEEKLYRIYDLCQKIKMQ